MTRVLGIDPSLTATGMALIDLDDQLVVDAWTIRTNGHKDDAIRERLGRLDTIVHQVSCVDDTSLVVIEYPSLGQARGGAQLDRNGLWWFIVAKFAEYRTPLAVVSPASRAKYATGKGNASKGAVVDAVARRFPHVQTGGDDNVCDALILAAMGARHLGAPIDDMPKTHTTAMDAVTWPEVRR